MIKLALYNFSFRNSALIKILLVASLYQVNVIPSWAQSNLSMEAALKEIEDIKPTETVSLNAISRLEEDLAPKRKELRLWEEQKGAVQQRQNALEIAKENLNKDILTVQRMSAVFNTNCVGSMPRPRYEKCAGEKAVIESKNEVNMQRKEQLQREIAVHNKRTDDVKDRMKVLQTQIDEWERQQASHRKALEEAERRLHILLTFLKQICDNEPTTPEAIKYCPAIVWDGARKGLPVLAR